MFAAVPPAPIGKCSDQPSKRTRSSEVISIECRNSRAPMPCRRIEVCTSTTTRLRAGIETRSASRLTVWITFGPAWVRTNGRHGVSTTTSAWTSAGSSS